MIAGIFVRPLNPVWRNGNMPNHHPNYKPPKYASYPAGVGPEDFLDLSDLDELEDGNYADEEYDRRREEEMDERRREQEA